MPFTRFCLFLSLSLSHFSLLFSFSLDFLFFFLVLFKDSIHANFSVECPGTNTGASPRARSPISLPLCGDLFSFLLANFQPVSTSHLHSNDTAKETLAKAASSVQVFTAAWRKIAASDLGRLERFDQWSLFLQNFGAQLQFYLSRGTVRRWLGFLPYVLQSWPFGSEEIQVSDEPKQLFPPEPGAKRWLCFVLTEQRRFSQAFSTKK